MTLQEYNDLYKRPLLKQMTIVSSGGITIKNANIVSEEMSLEKSLCSETNLRYGRCEAACFKVRIADINHDFTGEWLTVTQDVVTDSEGYLLTQNGQYLLTEDGFKIKLKNEQIDEASATYGLFRVHSDKPSNDRRWRDLTCYDIMYDILNADVISWYNGLTFPMTLKNLRDSFFTYLGITQETTTLINDSFVTPGGFSVSGSLSGKTVIESICELNGVFGQITGDGKFQYVSLSSPPTLTLDYYVDGTGSYEDYVTEAVTGINAKGTTDDVGTIVGTNTNLYIINGNPLIYGTEGTQGLTTALNNLLQHIMGVQYRPYGVTTYGNPMLPLGTKLTINTKNQIIVSYVTKKKLTGIQSLKDTMSATGEKHQPTAVNSPKTAITRTKGKVHELEVTVDGLTSRVSATETNLSNNYSTTNQMNSAIQQSATAITTQVSNNYVTQAAYNAEVQNLQDQIDGRIEYFDGNVVPTLNNAPASSWTTDAAKSSHVGDLYRYHHGTPEVVDYYRFDKDTSTTPATYSWVALGASQVDEALRLAEEANDKADAAQAQLDALQQSVEDDYYTKTQTDSQISQSATNITTSVASTYETKSNATSNYNSLDSAAQGYANSALATANTNAQGYADDAKNAANTATDTKLQNYYTKTQTDSQISQTASSITSSVSSNYETKADATSKLNTANTNAQTYANSARDSANASTDTKLQNYYTKTETETKISQTADSITSTVASTYTTKQEFNNLEIGGANLLRWTESPENKGGWSTSIVPSESTGWYIFGTSNMTAQNTNDGVKYTHANNTNNAGFCIPLVDYDAVIGGEEITLSFQYRTNLMSVGTPYLLISDQSSVTGNVPYSGTLPTLTPSSTDWKTYQATITFPSSSGKILSGFMPVYFGVANGWIEIRNKSMKLEKGNKVTDWSPSSEDLNANAQEYATTALTTARSEITQLANKVAVKVNSAGRLVTAELGVDPSSATSYVKVKADDLDIIANGNLQLTAKSIGITSTNFSVTSAGVVTCSNITATGGRVGGWKISSNGLYDDRAETTGDLGAGCFKYGTGPAFWAGCDLNNTNYAPFRVLHDGTFVSSKGLIAGWTITSGKIYGGDSNTGVSVMQKPSSNITWVFASGGTSHDAYANCPFKVSKNGSVFAKWLNITPNSTSGAANTGYFGYNEGSSPYTGLALYGSNGSSAVAMNSMGGISGKTLTITGTKNRIVETEDYGNRLLYCYETPTPMFGDIGEGKIAEDGKCYIWIDSVFRQTIAESSYQVFIQKYNDGECFIAERKSDYFVVEGTPGLKFGWEIKAKQKSYDMRRLDQEIQIISTRDYGTFAIDHLNELNEEREVA